MSVLHLYECFATGRHRVSIFVSIDAQRSLLTLSAPY